jgi:hypothetical protein
LRIWRAWGKEAPLWSAEVILYFEREDWADKIPAGEKLCFEPHYRSGTEDERKNVIPVYRIDEFKGLEAEGVLLFFPPGLPIANQELYVGASRARSILLMLFDRRVEHSLPVPVGRFWCEQQQTDGDWKSRSAPEPNN